MIFCFISRIFEFGVLIFSDLLMHASLFCCSLRELIYHSYLALESVLLPPSSSSLPRRRKSSLIRERKEHLNLEGAVFSRDVCVTTDTTTHHTSTTKQMEHNDCPKRTCTRATSAEDQVLKESKYLLLLMVGLSFDALHVP